MEWVALGEFVLLVFLLYRYLKLRQKVNRWLTLSHKQFTDARDYVQGILEREMALKDLRD